MIPDNHISIFNNPLNYIDKTVLVVNDNRNYLAILAYLNEKGTVETCQTAAVVFKNYIEEPLLAIDKKHIKWDLIDEIPVNKIFVLNEIPTHDNYARNQQ